MAIAQKGSLPELKQELDRARQHDLLDRRQIQHLAFGILDREIQSAVDPDGELLLERLSNCALALKEPLQRRARRSDHTAAMAQLLLANAGWQWPDAKWGLAAQSSLSERRAAAARDTLHPSRWLARHDFLNDPDQRVRQAALRSCLAAPAPQDWDTQVSILRRDPDPQCRQLAAKVIGLLGGPEASTVLSDVWARADQPLRLAIVSGWAQERTFFEGGREQLVAVARSEAGIVGVLAAADLASGDSSVQLQGRARITRALEFGSVEDRPLAVAAATWSLPEQARLLLRLGLAAEPETRVLALGRWLEQPAHRWPALTWLRQLAEPDTREAIMARELLAKAGDATVLSALRAQLRYAKLESRAHAARNLWRLKDVNGLAQALADDAPEVRVTAACVAIAP